MNPVVALIALRLGFFVLPLGLLAVLGAPPTVAVLVAAVLSVLLSAVFLRDQRRRVGELIEHLASRGGRQGADAEIPGENGQPHRGPQNRRR